MRAEKPHQLCGKPHLTLREAPGFDDVWVREMRKQASEAFIIFAGKTSVAQALAARYNLALLNPEDLVAKAAAAAEQHDQQGARSSSGFGVSK